jgi:hypothetical protein
MRLDVVDDRLAEFNGEPEDDHHKGCETVMLADPSLCQDKREHKQR